jgi:hypothetical protein
MDAPNKRFWYLRSDSCTCGNIGKPMLIVGHSQETCAGSDQITCDTVPNRYIFKFLIQKFSSQKSISGMS